MWGLSKKNQVNYTGAHQLLIKMQLIKKNCSKQTHK